MRILVTNDDGFQAKGLDVLVRILRNYGDLTVVAPKTHQSGMSMAVTMGLKPVAVKKIVDKPHEQWWYLDGTPASCVKFGLDIIMADARPDLVVSGINHGSNAATAALYSGTLGAAMEAAVNSVPGIGVSLDSLDSDADFSCVEELLPGILDNLLPNMSGRFGQFYNINFPALPASEIKGVKLGTMGRAHWEEEFQLYNSKTFKDFGLPEALFIKDAESNAEEGETLYIMLGNFTDDESNGTAADHRIVADGYVALTAHNIDNTDREEYTRLCGII